MQIWQYDRAYLHIDKYTNVINIFHFILDQIIIDIARESA